MKNAMFLVFPLCAIFILVGGWMMISSARKVWLGIKARDWPQTTGRMLRVESKENPDAEVSSREIQVHYSYNVRDREYEGWTIHPSYTSSSFETTHRDLEAALQNAKEVRVYYDEAQPERSTLCAGFYSSSLALVFAGFIFMGAGLSFLLVFWFALMGDWDFARGITVIQ